MSKFFKAKKVVLGIATIATVIVTSLGSYTQVYAYAPGCSKEEIEVPNNEESTPSFELEVSKQEEITSSNVGPEVSKQEETVTPPTATSEAPARIYNQDWSINPNDWTYTETQWTDGTATVEGHYGSDAEVQKMYELINEYRVANGKEPLTYNIKMNTVKLGADERAITSANYWEHWSYRFSENIAYTPVFYSDYDDMEMVEKVLKRGLHQRDKEIIFLMLVQQNTKQRFQSYIKR